MSDIRSRVGDFIDRTMPFGRGWEERSAHNERMQQLQRQAALRDAQDAVKPKLTPTQLAQQKLEFLRGTRNIETESLGRTGQTLLDLYLQKNAADTASTKSLEAARTDNTRSLDQARTDQMLRLIEPYQRDNMSHRLLDEQRYQDTLALARQQQAENLQLQKDQLSSNRTMGLLTSLLGTGLAAAALFG